MLADRGAPEPHSQGLLKGLHQAGTQFLKLIEFIAEHLPKWRSDSARPDSAAEDVLSEHLCDYLNDEARNVQGIECFKFGREPRDEASPKRNLDISAKPVGDWLWVGPRHYSKYHSFLPIECKRLPMPEPKRRDRDHREYIYDQHKSAGGVQRFKAGHHGEKHSIAAMIGYVQADKADEWLPRINSWVSELVSESVDGWSTSDALSLDYHDSANGLAELTSCHSRIGNLPDIDIKHLWIEMERR